MKVKKAKKVKKDKKTKVVEIPNRVFLEMLLKDEHISLEKWDMRNGYKTIGHLWSEIQSCETYFSRNRRSWKLKKHVRSVCMQLYGYSAGGKLYILRAYQQRFKGGGRRVRGSSRTSFSEKLRHGEMPQQGIFRGIREELDLEGKKIVIRALPKRKEKSWSTSYPGLRQVKHKHPFIGILWRGTPLVPYRENQWDKVTLFRWERVPCSQVNLGVYKKARRLSRARKNGTIRSMPTKHPFSCKKTYVIRP